MTVEFSGQCDCGTFCVSQLLEDPKPVAAHLSGDVIAPQIQALSGDVIDHPTMTGSAITDLD